MKYTGAIVGLLIFSSGCGQKNQQALPPEVKAGVCGKGNISSLNEASCADVKMTEIPTPFFSSNDKIKKNGEFTYVLRWLSEGSLIKEPKQLNDYTDLLSGLESELIVLKNDKIVSKSRDENRQIIDFDVREDGTLAVVISDKQDNLRLQLASAEGHILLDQALVDSDQNADPCFTFKDMQYLFGDCKNSSDSQQLRLPIQNQLYRTVQVAWGKNGDIYTLIDRGGMGVTNLYAWKKGSQDQISLRWKKNILKNTKMAFGIPVGLTGGDETVFLNRFGQFFQKHLLIDGSGDLYVFVNSRTWDNIIEIDGGSDKNEMHVVAQKFSSSGQRQWSRKIRKIDDVSAPLAAVGLYQDRIHILVNSITTRQDKTWSHDLTLIQLQATTGNIEKQTTVDLSRHDVGYGLVSVGINQVIVTGVTNFDQNPFGMSGSGTATAFAATFDFATGALNPFLIKASARKDVLKSVIYDRGQVISVMDLNGPYTHSADQDIRQASQQTAVVTIPISVWN